jgi:hypothetical protein
MVACGSGDTGKVIRPFALKNLTLLVSLDFKFCTSTYSFGVIIVQSEVFLKLKFKAEIDEFKNKGTELR